MKTLEKDRNRRYETANGLARDIQRHLNNEPVVAARRATFTDSRRWSGATSWPSPLAPL